MRTLLFFFVSALPLLLSGQAPEAINYQAVARDGNGQVLVNQSLDVRLTIKANGPAGTTVYQETHTSSTNDYGLFDLLIGQGNVNTGTFSTIDWGQNSYFLKVEVDDGSGYIDLGTTQFVAVPYALYAKESGNATSYNAGTGIDINNNTISNTAPDQVVSLTGAGGTSISGTYPSFTISSTGTGATYTAGNGIDITANTISNTAPDQTVTLTGAGATSITGSYPNFVITSTDNNTTYNAGTGLILTGQTFAAQNQSALWNANQLQGRPLSNSGPGNGDLLKWDGTAWAPAADDTGTSWWTYQSGDLYFNTGKVAIGRTSPAVALHVAANEEIVFGNGLSGEGKKWLFSPAHNAVRSGELTASQKDLWDPDSLGSGSFAHGTNVIARGPGAVAFGSNSLATGDYTFAAGIDSRAAGHFSTAFGATAHAEGANSLASGFQVQAQGDQSVAIGHLDTASGNNSVAIGIANAATGDGAIAMGEEARAYGSGAIAMGTTVRALASGIAIGDGAFATDIYSIAIGKGLTSSGEFSVAIGGSPTASGNFSTSIGFLTQAQGFGAIAMGEGDTASGNHSVAMGLYSAATDDGAVAIGRQAISRGEGVAIGSQAFALNDGDVALGDGNEARGGRSFAVGAGNITNAVGSAALGSGNVVNGIASTAVGLGNTINSPHALAAGIYSEGLNNVLFEIGAGSQVNPVTIFNVMTNGEVGIQNTDPEGMLHIGTNTGANLYIGSVENISDGGGFTLLCDTDLDPDTDGGHSLGSSSLRWNRLYTENGVVTTSDKREKRGITDLSYGLATLMQLRPVSYTWKEDNPNQSTQLGLIAQELQQVIPEVVVDTDVVVNEETGEREEVPAERLGVKYADLIPVLIKSVQEQQATIESLQAEVEALKAQLKE